jgi:hypothetical protein
VTLSPGRRVSLHADWHVASRAHSPEDEVSNGGEPAPEHLDYAVIRLSAKVGKEPVGARGAADNTATPRGWLSLPAEQSSFQVNSPVIVLQHPLLPGLLKQQPVQLSLGVMLDSPYPRLRLRHNARTLQGSSGSPCFDAGLEFVALHHAGDPVYDWERPAWNQAIPIQNIGTDLAARGIVLEPWES